MKKFDSDYDSEIRKIRKEQDEIKNVAGKNSYDIISFGLNMEKYKEEIECKMKILNEKIGILQSSVSDLQKEKEELARERRESNGVESAISDVLIYKDVCRIIDIRYLTETTMKYYLYEQGLLDIKINKVHNSFRISPRYERIHSPLKEYIHIRNNTFVFDPAIIDYLKNHRNELELSISRYQKKSRCFTRTKEKLDATEIKNFRSEVNRICGTGDNYDKDKWAAIYRKYEADHPDFAEEYKSYVREYMSVHSSAKYKPTKIMYLIQERNDGDILLKIACELFVE